MVDGALDKLGLGLLKNIVDDMCGALKFCVDAIEMRKGTCFSNFSKTKKKNAVARIAFALTGESLNCTFVY